MGDQGHLDLQYGFNPDLMTQDLRQYASLGLKVAITRFCRIASRTVGLPGVNSNSKTGAGMRQAQRVFSCERYHRYACGV